MGRPGPGDTAAAPAAWRSWPCRCLSRPPDKAQGVEFVNIPWLKAFLLCKHTEGLFFGTCISVCPLCKHVGIQFHPELILWIGASPTSPSCPCPDTLDGAVLPEVIEAVRVRHVGILVFGETIDDTGSNVVDVRCLSLIFPLALHLYDLLVSPDAYCGIEGIALLTGLVYPVAVAVLIVGDTLGDGSAPEIGCGVLD